MPAQSRFVLSAAAALCGCSTFAIAEPGSGDRHAARLLPIPGSIERLALWEGIDADGSSRARFAISLDGLTYSELYDHDGMVHLRYADFDPLGAAGEVPLVTSALEGSADSNIFIVQFHTTPLDIFRAQIEAAGGVVYNYLATNSYLCKLDSDAARAAVRSLPYVRWVGVYQPAYRLDPRILDAHFGRPGRVTGAPYGRDSVGSAATDAEFAAGTPAVFNIQVFERGLAQKRTVADTVRALGGSIQSMIPDGFLLQARLTKDQLTAILHMDEVLFVDAWSPPEPTMNNVRILGGANFIESTLGLTGQGVRAEVSDTSVLTTHIDLSGAPSIIFHTTGAGELSHGTHTTGIVFGRGVGDANARGLLPGAQQPMFSHFGFITNRYTHTAQLVDPVGPYRAVFQTNSWGNFPLGLDYLTRAQELDDILFQYDLLILHGFGNEGFQGARIEGLAKNVVTVGGISHGDSLDWSIHRRGSASQGPAADGRIKPDLASMYDRVWSPASGGPANYGDFGGTSAATPIVAGHFGIMFQMWHQQFFAGFGGKASVFASRPHMTTAKALMINTARQWDMTIPGTNVRRGSQGWGHPDLVRLYEMRDRMFIVDETEVLAPLQSKSYPIRVAPDEPALKATMTYADRPGATSSTQHRINLLTLKVTDPAGSTFYWGNNGMTDAGMWSTAGGSANTKDTVQNVFVQDPAAGVWTVEVRADALVQDGRVETPETDADFALIVTGGTLVTCRVDLNGDGVVDFGDYLDFLNLFDALDPRVDFTGDGVIDFGDYLEFLNLFDTGC